MIIQVTPKYRIESDLHCWSISRYQGMQKNKKGVLEAAWRSFSYLDSLPSAIERLAEILTRDDPLKTDSLKEALDRAENIAKTVVASIERSHQENMVCASALERREATNGPEGSQC